MLLTAAPSVSTAAQDRAAHSAHCLQSRVFCQQRSTPALLNQSRLYQCPVSCIACLRAAHGGLSGHLRLPLHASLLCEQHSRDCMSFLVRRGTSPCLSLPLLHAHHLTVSLLRRQLPAGGLQQGLQGLAAGGRCVWELGSSASTSNIVNSPLHDTSCQTRHDLSDCCVETLAAASADIKCPQCLLQSTLQHNGSSQPA